VHQNLTASSGCQEIFHLLDDKGNQPLPKVNDKLVKNWHLEEKLKKSKKRVVRGSFHP